MRRLRRVALLLVTALVGIIGALPAVATAAGPAATPPSQCPSNGVASGSATKPPLPGASYFQDNFLLGPKSLPKTGEVAQLLEHYQRFHAMGPNKLLACYSRSTGPSVWQWVYPQDNGFTPGHELGPVLTPGQTLQRFGPTSGQLLAPYPTPYEKLAIPPNNLEQWNTGTAPNNYYKFIIVAEFKTDQGGVAPWFQQPGGGTQYFTKGATDQYDIPVPASDSTKGVTVCDLVQNGYLQSVTPAEPPKICPP